MQNPDFTAHMNWIEREHAFPSDPAQFHAKRFEYMLTHSPLEAKLRSIPGISQKVLTDNLRALEHDGIITRTVYPEVPPRVEYALSGLGETMRPIIKAMEAWGTEYQQKVREGG